MTLQVNLDPKVYEGRQEEFQPGVSAVILPYTRRTIRRIMSAATVINSETNETHVDPELWDLHLYREIIKDISGIVSPDGSPVVCNDGVIDIVCDQVEGFAAWALAKSREFAVSITTQVKVETKNLKRSRGGNPKGLKDSAAKGAESPGTLTRQRSHLRANAAEK